MPPIGDMIAAVAGGVGGLALLVCVCWKCCTPPVPPGAKKSAAAELGVAVLAGTMLMPLTSLGAPALDAVLAAGEALPLVGEVCRMLHGLKKHADQFLAESEQYSRLSVWCLAMMGSFSECAQRLDEDGYVVTEANAGLLHEAATAVKELHDLVVARRESSQGVAGQMFAFWTSSDYLAKANRAKERVQQALNALMLKSSPKHSTLNPLPSTLDLQSSTLTPSP